MTTVPQPQCFSWLATIKNGSPVTTQIQRLHPKSFTFAFKFKNFRVLSSLGNSSSGNSSEKPLQSSPSDVDPVKLAFDKAKACKKAIQSNPTPDVVEDQDSTTCIKDGEVSKNVELNAGASKDEVQYEGPVKLAFEKSQEFAKKNENPFQELDAINKKDAQANDEGNKEEKSRTGQQVFEKAKDYRMKKNDGGDGGEFVIGSAGTSGRAYILLECSFK